VPQNWSKYSDIVFVEESKAEQTIQRDASFFNQRRLIKMAIIRRQYSYSELFFKDFANITIIYAYTRYKQHCQIV